MLQPTGPELGFPPTSRLDSATGIGSRLRFCHCTALRARCVPAGVAESIADPLHRFNAPSLTAGLAQLGAQTVNMNLESIRGRRRVVSPYSAEEFMAAHHHARAPDQFDEEIEL